MPLFPKDVAFLPKSNIIRLILKFHHVFQFIRIIKFIHIFIFSSSLLSFFFLELLLIFKVNCIIRLSNLFHLTLFLIFITSFLLHNLTISCAPLVKFFSLIFFHKFIIKSILILTSFFLSIKFFFKLSKNKPISKKNQSIISKIII